MHEFRTALRNGEVPVSAGPVASKERCRRASEATLCNIAIPREERRRTNQRREDRFAGLIDRATITFRRKKSLVPVVNVSSGGLMIESALMPWIGERVGVEIEGHDRIEAVVRWVRGGRIGLDVGEGAIGLD
ncbi:MAG: PilZ domain-containing protein [Sphingosinicella sp.]